MKFDLKVVLVVIYTIVISCNGAIKEDSCFCSIPNVWQIVVKDSVYYEYYFDQNKQFFYDGYRNITNELSGDYKNKFDALRKQLTLDARNNKTVILNYLKNISGGLVDGEVIELRPIGFYNYSVSDNEDENRDVYDRYAYKRFKAYKGEVGALDTLEEIFIEEDIILIDSIVSKSEPH